LSQYVNQCESLLSRLAETSDKLFEPLILRVQPLDFLAARFDRTEFSHHGEGVYSTARGEGLRSRVIVSIPSRPVRWIRRRETGRASEPRF